ncbi:MAG: aspartate--tRNA ligase [candidate division Zixibacteria bacterium]|nr:aspartate--tRNA ligase [candidate division Zixibacteria bacterium]
MGDILPSFSELKRTHTCGELTAADVGKAVTLNGWVQEYRNLGGLLFIDVRDRYGLTQIVLNPEKVAETAFALATRARHEYVIAATGVVQPRPEGTVNAGMATGEIEVAVDEFHILAESKTPPFEIEDVTEASDVLRLEYRYLDLRRRPLQNNLRIRHFAARAIREYFSDRDFYEIETPLLIRSTPEGARDYVVPSRVQKHKFYALPQSPQLFKQILMISGYDRYFQLARCLRDEDLRADRQPEHTQLDMEMSFVTRGDIFGEIEGMMTHLFRKVLGVKLETPFPRYDYYEAMNRWGIDKPDLRFGMEINDITDIVADCGFKVFSDVVKNGGVVKALCLKGGGNYSRKQVDELTDVAKQLGAGGLAYILRAETGDKSPIMKFIGEDVKDAICAKVDASAGDAVFIVSDKKLKTESILGQLRLQLGRRHELIKKDEWQFLWVTRFPLFEYNEDEDRLDAMHNIVSSPIDEDLPLLDRNLATDLPISDWQHPLRRIRAEQYDLVLNGTELGSGSIRVHQRHIQQRILNILGMSDERAEKMFGFLLRALEYGAPPHGGIALGLDRIVALMTGNDNIREVIAFPKTASAASLMDGSPSDITPEQLRELGLEFLSRD